MYVAGCHSTNVRMQALICLLLGSLWQLQCAVILRPAATESSLYINENLDYGPSLHPNPAHLQKSYHLDRMTRAASAQFLAYALIICARTLQC